MRSQSSSENALRERECMSFFRHGGQTALTEATPLILRSRASGVSKDAGLPAASWFETRFALLTMRVS